LRRVDSRPRLRLTRDRTEGTRLHREYRPEQMRLGVPSPPDSHHGHGVGHPHHHEGEPAHNPELERRVLLTTTVVVGLLLLADLVLAALGSPWRAPFGVPLALLAAVIGGGRVIYLALAALFEGSVGADIALAIACVAAACLGEFFVATEVVFIALVGECLEALTFKRAQRAIGQLIDYYPSTTRVIRDDAEIEVPTEALVIGDRVVVRPGERISVDGTVICGRSAIDQAVLTGESMPVDKGEGDPVYTGTFNQFGRLEVRPKNSVQPRRWVASSSFWPTRIGIVPIWSGRPTSTLAGSYRLCSAPRRWSFWERMGWPCGNGGLLATPPRST
jgi:cation transport ATPase